MSCHKKSEVSRAGVSSTHLVEVDAHTLELKLRSAIVNAIAVEAMLARDGLPKSGTDLVTLSGKCEPPNMSLSRCLEMIPALTH